MTDASSDDNSKPQPPPSPIEEVQREAQAASGPQPVIDRIPDEKIHVGAGGRLVVPREDLGAALDVGDELDLAELAAKKIRKPTRREWIALDPGSQLTTRLLQYKPNPNVIEVAQFYVDKGLRNPIRDELTDVRVFLCFSFNTKSHFLWVVNVTPGNSWYESLVPLLQRPADFFEKYAIRVFSERSNFKYRVKFKPLPSQVTWSGKATEELLGEAIGPAQFITSPDHPRYQDLIEGMDLD